MSAPRSPSGCSRSVRRRAEPSNSFASPRSLFALTLAPIALVACAKRDDPAVVRGPVAEAGVECPRSEGPRVVGRLENAALVEVSGLAASALHGDTFYAHNDSGDFARIFALRADGKLVAELALTGVDATDFEDVATGPCGSDHCVYVADIGDNAAKRTEVAVHRFVEPATLASGTVHVTTTRFRYEDGPHNAESVLVDPRDGSLYVVTKEKSGVSALFAVPQEGGLASLRARFAPPLGSNLFTGSTFASTGDRVALRTYTHAFVYPVLGNEPLARALERPPCVVESPPEPQGEAIAFTRDGRALRFASEGNGVPFYEVSLGTTSP